jgi:uncharacterized protein YukE
MEAAMGYYTQITDADFLIPKANEATALAALKALNGPEYNSQKQGGAWGAGSEGKTEAWYSWMTADYDQHVKSCADVFEQLGFEVEQTAEGMRLTGYDNKTGQEDLFLNAVAPFVAADSFLAWRGEDGTLYRFEFDGTKMIEMEARVSWVTSR